MHQLFSTSLFFFFNDTATTEIYTLSLHDALPILFVVERVDAGARLRQFLVVEDERGRMGRDALAGADAQVLVDLDAVDRKSTRLNSSHANISYAVFCLKKKKKSIM